MWVTGFIFILFIDKVKEPTNNDAQNFFYCMVIGTETGMHFTEKKVEFSPVLFLFWSVNLQNESIFHFFQCNEIQLQFCCIFFLLYFLLIFTDTILKGKVKGSILFS